MGVLFCISYKNQYSHKKSLKYGKGSWNQNVELQKSLHLLQRRKRQEQKNMGVFWKLEGQENEFSPEVTNKTAYPGRHTFF